MISVTQSGYFATNMPQTGHLSRGAGLTGFRSPLHDSESVSVSVSKIRKLKKYFFFPIPVPIITTKFRFTTEAQRAQRVERMVSGESGEDDSPEDPTPFGLKLQSDSFLFVGISRQTKKSLSLRTLCLCGEKSILDKT